MYCAYLFPTHSEPRNSFWEKKWGRHITLCYGRNVKELVYLLTTLFMNSMYIYAIDFSNGESFFLILPYLRNDNLFVIIHDFYTIRYIFLQFLFKRENFPVFPSHGYESAQYMSVNTP